MRKSLEKTSYPGVATYTDDTGQKTYYIRYRRGGRGTSQINEPVGKASEGMTAKKASLIRSDRMRGEPSNVEKRKKAAEDKACLPVRWTLEMLWEAYIEAHPKDEKDSNRRKETWLFNNRLKKPFGNKTVDELSTMDIDRFRNKLMKSGLKPATVKLPMELMRRLLNFGDKQGYCIVPRTLHFNFPKVDNQKTEYLTDEQMVHYKYALTQYKSRKYSQETEYYIAYAQLIMRTGIRRAAATALKWEDCDFERGFIALRGEEAKNDKTKYIPMSEEVQKILKALPHTYGEFIFPQRDKSTYTRKMRKIRELAGLPKDFRPIHGLHHNFASRVASSGKVDLYTLQNLLTHSSPAMTQRYAHLADKAMHRAAEVIDDVMDVSSPALNLAEQSSSPA